jgi:hypothetical protein
MYQVRLVARWPLPYRFQLCRATDRGFMLTWEREAGSGKTTEMKACALALAAAGQVSFYATVEDVGHRGLEAHKTSEHVSVLAPPISENPLGHRQ